MLDRQAPLGCTGQASRGQRHSADISEPPKVVAIAGALWGVNSGAGERVTSLCNGEDGLTSLLDVACSRAIAPQRPAADVHCESQYDHDGRKIWNAGFSHKVK